MFVGVPLISTLWLITALVWPPFLEHLIHFDSVFLVPTIGLSLILTYLISKKFNHYAQSPEVAENYRDIPSRRITRVVFVTAPVLWVSLIGFALYLVKP